MHIIRLRGPWQLEPVCRYVCGVDGRREVSKEQLPPAAPRAKMPGDWSAWLGPDFHGCVRHLRRFNTPTGLEPTTTVWLVVEPPRSRGTIRLNEVELGQVRQAAGRFDITPLLAEHNRLVVDVEHPLFEDDASSYEAATGGLTGEVRLEIDQG